MWRLLRVLAYGVAFLVASGAWLVLPTYFLGSEVGFALTFGTPIAIIVGLVIDAAIHQ